MVRSPCTPMQTITLLKAQRPVAHRRGSGWVAYISGPFPRIHAGMSNESKPRVLIIEDDEALRRLVSDALTRHGYRVSALPDVRAALNALPSARVADVLVVDVEPLDADSWWT